MISRQPSSEVGLVTEVLSTYLSVTGCSRFGPAHGFCLRIKEICHTENQHCFYLFETLFPYKKLQTKQSLKFVCTNYKLPPVFNLILLSIITVYHFFQL